MNQQQSLVVTALPWTSDAVERPPISGCNRNAVVRVFAEGIGVGLLFPKSCPFCKHKTTAFRLWTLIGGHSTSSKVCGRDRTSETDLSLWLTDPALLYPVSRKWRSNFYQRLEAIAVSNVDNCALYVILKQQSSWGWISWSQNELSFRWSSTKVEIKLTSERFNLLCRW